jgi:hypothetical protein
MAVTLNALTTGVGGLQTTGDTSGQISLQSNGSTVLAVTASGVTITGTLSSTSAVSVASGGTGATTLTANNVILGNGTSAVTFVAPGSNGNVLTSNGTTWTSAAPAGGVTSLNGQTGAITNTTLYAIGSYILGRPNNLTSYGVNTTIAGSSLYATTTHTGYSSSFGPGFWADVNTASGTNQTAFVNTGTWRSVSPAGTLNNGSTWAVSGLWVRIS